MSSFRDQKCVEVDVPRVLLYKNYVMYDRWMSYKRFNSYYQDNSQPWKSDDDERQYYNKNLMNFLVLKYRKRKDGSIGDYDFLLYDSNYKNIYILGDYIHIYETEVLADFYNEYFGVTFPITRIVATRPPDFYCISIVDEWAWCDNIHKNENGYCDEHQHQSREFEDIDLDRLLTFGELLNLPNFSVLRNLNFQIDSDEQKYDENEPCRRYHTFDSDTDFSDSDVYKYDDDDYDDRRHGPEGTIEDNDNTETEEKKEEEQLTERELYWKDQQEIAELQEQAIIDDDIKYREYAREQMEKLTKEEVKEV
jgi:hypothetical protein